MDYLTLIWTTIQLLLIFAAASGAICLIIGLFHPITVNLKLRASQLGQRGEIWGSYLFGLVKIGVIATPHNQDVALKILYWQKFLQRNRRQKPTRPQPPPATPWQPATDSASATAPKTTDSMKPQPTTESAAASVKPAESSPAAISKEEKRAETVKAESAVQAKPDSEPAIQTDAEKETEKKSVSEAAIESKTKIENMKTPEAETAGETEPGIMSESTDGIRAEIMTEDSTEPFIKADELDSEPAPVTRQQPVDVTPVDVTPLKPVAEVAKEQQAAEKSEPAAGIRSDDQTEKAAAGGSDWRARARRFRRDLNNRYQQLKRYIRLFMRKWQVVWPILQRFWGRGKKGFNLVEPTLKVRYALHEPYITGMFHGSISIFSGLAAQFGLNFIPVPMFGEPCIYARGRVTAVIRPWRFLAAMLGLLFERDLYREAWQAFSWYRARRQQA
ncbi:MAG TPA: hypothetical protein PLK28_18075 [Candidatus Rifleibacterium sp.]|nr:hypothetical protein [Candidatus Rifleibacterium sp.]